MKSILIILLICNISFAQRLVLNVDFKNENKTFVQKDGFSVGYNNLKECTIFLNPINPDKINNQFIDSKDKLNWLFTETFYAMLEKYKISGDRDICVAIWHNGVYQGTILKIDNNLAKKLNNRTFENNEIFKSIPNKYPAKMIFKQFKLMKYTKNKPLIYSDLLTKNYVSFLKDYYFRNSIETKAELDYKDIFTYVKEDNLSYMKKYKKLNLDLNLKNSEGYSILTIASNSGSTKIVKYLIENGININQKNNDGTTALIYAIFGNQYEMVKLLLKNNADVNLYPSGYEHPYKLAKRKSYNAIAKLLKPYSNFKSNSSFLYSSSNLQNTCKAMTKHKVDCYKIKNKDMQNFCIGVTEFPSNCYQIGDSDLQKVCTAKTVNQVDCYSIKDKNMQNFCIGITKSSTNCYQIDDSKLQKYCIAISSHNYGGCF